MVAYNLLIFTTAPVDYDYNCNKVIMDAGTFASHRGAETVRLILGCDDSRANYQAGRYASGMHFTRQGADDDLFYNVEKGYLKLSDECFAWLEANDYADLAQQLKDMVKRGQS